MGTHNDIDSPATAVESVDLDQAQNYAYVVESHTYEGSTDDMIAAGATTAVYHRLSRRLYVVAVWYVMTVDQDDAATQVLAAIDAQIPGCRAAVYRVSRQDAPESLPWLTAANDDDLNDDGVISDEELALAAMAAGALDDEVTDDERLLTEEAEDG